MIGDGDDDSDDNLCSRLGSMPQAHRYYSTLESLLKMQSIPDHAKTFRYHQ